MPRVSGRVPLLGVGELDGEPFRAFLPEHFDGLTFENLLDITLEGQSNPSYSLLQEGARELL